MSTLKVNTIQDASGSNGTTPALLYNGTAKAWVNFDGTGSSSANQTIRASYNVSSAFKNSTGNYTVNFTNALTDANYVVLKSFGAAASSYGYESTVLSQTTTSVNILTLGSAGSAVDRATVSVGILR